MIPAGVVAVIIIIIGVVDAVLKHNPTEVIKRAFVFPIISSVAMVILVPAIDGLIGLVSWMGATYDNALGGWSLISAGMVNGIGPALDQLKSGGNITAVLLIPLAILAMFGIIIELAIRANLIALIVIFFPMMLAGLSFPGTMHWVRRIIELLVAIILTPLFITIVLSFASVEIVKGNGIFTVALVFGSLFLATLGMPILMKIVPITVHAASTHMGSGAGHISRGSRQALSSGSDALASPLPSGSVVPGAGEAGGGAAGATGGAAGAAGGAAGAGAGLSAVAGPLALAAAAVKLAKSQASASTQSLTNSSEDRSSPDAISSTATGPQSQTNKSAEQPSKAGPSSNIGASSDKPKTGSNGAQVLGQNSSGANSANQSISAETTKPTKNAPSVLSSSTKAFAAGGVAGVLGHVVGHHVGSKIAQTRQSDESQNRASTQASSQLSEPLANTQTPSATSDIASQDLSQAGSNGQPSLEPSGEGAGYSSDPNNSPSQSGSGYSSDELESVLAGFRSGPAISSQPPTKGE